MRTIEISTWLKLISLFFLFSAASGSAASAQTPPRATSNLEAAVIQGMTVWITDADGREEKARIVAVSGGIVTTSAGKDIRRLRAGDITRVRARQSDSVLNGALIGAGAAVASGLFLCTRSEPWRNCRDDVGPMFRIGAVGAGLGIAIDALIRGRRTIYEAAPGSTRLHVTPIAGRHAGGLRISVGF